jgi:hypothetical protein
MTTNVQHTLKTLEKVLTPLAIRDMQIKTLLRFCLSPVGMAIIKDL